MSKNIKLGKIIVAIGTTSYWGVGIDYDFDGHALHISLIHWYLSIQKYWPPMTEEEFIAYLERFDNE